LHCVMFARMHCIMHCIVIVALALFAEERTDSAQPRSTAKGGSSPAVAAAM